MSHGVDFPADVWQRIYAYAFECPMCGRACLDDLPCWMDQLNEVVYTSGPDVGWDLSDHSCKRYRKGFWRYGWVREAREARQAKIRKAQAIQRRGTQGEASDTQPQVLG